MNVFIYVFIIWLISAIFAIALVKGANKKDDKNY